MRTVVVLNMVLLVAVTALVAVILTRTDPGTTPAPSTSTPAVTRADVEDLIERRASADMRTFRDDILFKLKGQAEKIRSLETSLAERERELSALRAGPGNGLVVTRRKETGEEERVDLGQYVEDRFKELAATESKTRDKEQRSRFARSMAPFVKGMARRGVRDAARRLNLNEEQTKQLQKTVDKAIENTTPAMLTLMDPDVSEAERATATTEVTQTFQTSIQETQSYLDPGQYQQIEQWSAQSSQQMQQFMQNFQTWGRPTSQPSGSSQ